MEDTLVFMYEKALREVPLFAKVERSFIRVVTQHLREMYFLKGDTVVLCKDLQTNIYIIYRGKVIGNINILSKYLIQTITDFFRTVMHFQMTIFAIENVATILVIIY